MIYTFDIPYVRRNGDPAEVDVCIDVQADDEDQAVEKLRAFASLAYLRDERAFVARPYQDVTAEEIADHASQDDVVGVDGIVELRFYLNIGVEPMDITAQMIGDQREDEQPAGACSLCGCVCPCDCRCAACFEHCGQLTREETP